MDILIIWLRIFVSGSKHGNGGVLRSLIRSASLCYNTIFSKKCAKSARKRNMEHEAERLVAVKSETFNFSLTFLKNAIKGLEEEEDVIMKNMKRVQTPIIFVDMSRKTADEEEGTLQESLPAEGSCQKATHSTVANSFAPELHQIGKAGGRNFGKRKRASEKLSKAPFVRPSVGAMPARPTSLPPVFSSFGPPTAHANHVPSFLGILEPAPQMPLDNLNRVLQNPSSETMFPRPVSHVVSHQGKWQNPSSKTMVTGPVPRAVSDTTKQVLQNPLSETMGTRPVPLMVSDKSMWVLENPTSETMVTGLVPRVVSDKGRRVVENPTSETMVTRPVPRVVSDKSKRILENPTSETMASRPVPPVVSENLSFETMLMRPVPRVVSENLSFETMVTRPVPRVASVKGMRVLQDPTSETMVMRPVARVVSDNNMRVLQNPSFETMVMRPVPRVVSDNFMQVLQNPSSETMFPRTVVPRVGKVVVENPSPCSSRLRFRSSKVEPSRPAANHSQHVVAPAPPEQSHAAPPVSRRVEPKAHPCLSNRVNQNNRGRQ